MFRRRHGRGAPIGELTPGGTNYVLLLANGLDSLKLSDGTSFLVMANNPDQTAGGTNDVLLLANAVDSLSLADGMSSLILAGS
jgi:hypothetical protein